MLLVISLGDPFSAIGFFAVAESAGAVRLNDIAIDPASTIGIVENMLFANLLRLFASIGFSRG